MAQNYSALCTAAVGDPITIAQLRSSTARRGQLVGVDIGCEGAPADNAIVWRIDRFTAGGTATQVTTVASGDLTDETLNQLTAYENCTVEPTYEGKPIWQEPINQRQTFHLELERRCLFTDLASGHGIGVRAQHDSVTPTADVTLWWTE